MTDQKTKARGFNAGIIEEFRANDGRVGGALVDATLILLHHVGAKSAIERVTLVAASLREDDSCVIVASSGGSLTHPAWCHNLRANPTIEVELGTETFTVLAEELKGRARAGYGRSWWRRLPRSASFKAGSRDGFRCSG